MSKHTWPVTMLEEYRVKEEILQFFQGYVEDYKKATKNLEELYEEHQLLQTTSSKQERYIAELEKQIGLLQKTLDLVDKNKPRFILKTQRPSQDEFFDSLNSTVIIPTGETSITPICPGCWIAVTERLPEDNNDRVLVATDSDCPFGNPKIDTDRYCDGRWVRYGDHVTHWMPLPEPPKEDE